MQSYHSCVNPLYHLGKGVHITLDWWQVIPLRMFLSSFKVLAQVLLRGGVGNQTSWTKTLRTNGNITDKTQQPSRGLKSYKPVGKGWGDRDPGKEKASNWPLWWSYMEKKMKENILSVTLHENYVFFLPKSKQEKIQDTCFLKIEVHLRNRRWTLLLLTNFEGAQKLALLSPSVVLF